MSGGSGNAGGASGGSPGIAGTGGISSGTPGSPGTPGSARSPLTGTVGNGGSASVGAPGTASASAGTGAPGRFSPGARTGSGGIGGAKSGGNVGPARPNATGRKSHISREPRDRNRCPEGDPIEIAPSEWGGRIYLVGAQQHDRENSRVGILAKESYGAVR